jgi:hypothetical protein
MTVPQTTVGAHGTPCAEPECERPCWVVKVSENIRRGVSRKRPPRLVKVSEFCREHSELPMFDVPTTWKPRRKGVSFRDAVRRRRLEQERKP